MSKKEERFHRSNRIYTDKLLNENTPFAVAEAFKAIRTNMFYVAGNEKCPVFGITSAYAHTGKSVVISNVALSFSQLGKKVLLIDADMRCPVAHKIFAIKNKKGLSDILATADGSDVSEYTQSINEDMDVITSGRIPPNPSELLASSYMRVFLEKAKEIYDYIFIDMPPICEVSDAGVLVDCVSGYIFVVRSGMTDRRALSSALGILKQMQAKVVGIVMNAVDPKRNTYGNKKYSKYNYYSKHGYSSNYEEEYRKNIEESITEESK